MIDGTASLIAVDPEDIGRANLTSEDHWVNSTVEYGEVNGGGYMATLEVFHQLHCLVRLLVHDLSFRCSNADDAIEHATQGRPRRILRGVATISRWVFSVVEDHTLGFVTLSGGSTIANRISNLRSLH